MEAICSFIGYTFYNENSIVLHSFGINTLFQSAWLNNSYISSVFNIVYKNATFHFILN